MEETTEDKWAWCELVEDLFSIQLYEAKKRRSTLQITYLNTSATFLNAGWK